MESVERQTAMEAYAEATVQATIKATQNAATWVSGALKPRATV